MSDLRARNAGPQPGDLGLPPSLRGERVNQKESVVDSIFSKRNLGAKAAIAVFVLIVLAYVTVQGNVAIEPMRRTAQGAATRMPRRPIKYNDPRMVNILPLGDEFTEGLMIRPSYRYPLFNLIRPKNASDTAFLHSRLPCMVGSLRGPGPDCPFDENCADARMREPVCVGRYEAYAQWRADQLVTGSGEIAKRPGKPEKVRVQRGTLERRLHTFPRVDIALVLLGVADILSADQRKHPGSTEYDFTRIISELRSVNPNVVILLGKPSSLSDNHPKRAGSYKGSDWATEYPKLLATIDKVAVTMTTEESPVDVVDFSHFDVNDRVSFPDGLHGTRAVAAKMAALWKEAMAPYIAEKPRGWTEMDEAEWKLANGNREVAQVAASE